MAENAAARVNCEAEIDMIFARTIGFVWVMLNRPTFDLRKGCPMGTSFKVLQVSNRRISVTFLHITGLGVAVSSKSYPSIPGKVAQDFRGTQLSRYGKMFLIDRCV